MKFTTYNKNNIQEMTQVFTDTFSDSEGNEEGSLIGVLAHDLLTTTNEKKLSAFIAIENDKIIGAVIFTKLSFDKIDVNAALLSPMAISTEYQKKGIGKQLIDFALNNLKESSVELVVTYGDINFYAKTGFQAITETQIKAPQTLSYPEGWLGQSLINDKIEPITGHSTCVEALNKPDFW